MNGYDNINWLGSCEYFLHSFRVERNSFILRPIGSVVCLMSIAYTVSICYIFTSCSMEFSTQRVLPLESSPADMPKFKFKRKSGEIVLQLGVKWPNLTVIPVQKSRKKKHQMVRTDTGERIWCRSLQQNGEHKMLSRHAHSKLWPLTECVEKIWSGHKSC